MINFLTLFGMVKPTPTTITRIPFAIEIDFTTFKNDGSALHKSLRGSDPQAALYWLARMLTAGEDPLYVLRRLTRFASEDIGNADPKALQIALEAKEAFHFIGLPEGKLALAQATLTALERKATTIHDYFKKGLASQKSFTALAREKALNVSTTALFSANSAPDALSSGEIISDITMRNAGELSDVVQGTDGPMIAYVVKRVPAAEDELSTIQNQVVMNLVRRRARVLFGEWQNSLVSGDRKKDTQAPVEIPETDDEDVK